MKLFKIIKFYHKKIQNSIEIKYLDFRGKYELILMEVR